MASSPNEIGRPPPVLPVATAATPSSPVAPKVELVTSAPVPSVKLVGDPTAVAERQDEKMARAELEAAAQALDGHIDQRRNDLRFRVDESSGRVVVSVVDARSGEVLRQIPGDVALRIARQIAQQREASSGLWA